MHSARTPAATAQTRSDFTDKTLQCQRFNDDSTKCDADFIWSAGEQLLHKRLGYLSKSCSIHKSAPRTYANARCGPTTRGAPSECDFNQIEQWKEHHKCRLYQRGACTYGNQCKFSHAPGQLASAHPSILPNDKRLANKGADEPIIWQVHMNDSEDKDYRKATVTYDEERGEEIIEW